MTLFDPGPPVCHVCGGRGRIFSTRLGMEIDCPECGARKGMAQTENAHDATDEWREKAEAVVRHASRSTPTTNTDILITTLDRLYPDLKTHGDRDEKRRWGPLMRRMEKEGVVEHTGTFIRSERRRKAPIPVWKCLLWRG